MSTPVIVATGVALLAVVTGQLGPSGQNVCKCGPRSETCPPKGRAAVCYDDNTGCHWCCDGWTSTYFSDNVDCTLDIDECKVDPGCEQKCVNTPGSFRCECHDGFRKDHNGSCQDIDECDVDRDEQSACEQKCVNNSGAFWCICHEGLPQDSADIDECKVDPRCARKCVDTPGSFRCECHDGWRKGQSGSCQDIDECDVDLDEQSRCEHMCLNIPGSFRCECPDGFSVHQNGTCQDIDECKVDQGCEQKCVNTPGSFLCECHDGWRKDHNGSCQDIDECDVDPDEQSRCDQKCVNSPGSFRCECHKGLCIHQNGTCQDIDECKSQAAYKYDGTYGCEAVYEYEEGTNQTCEQKCVNTPGSYRCECHHGFRKDQDGSCHDIDECDVDPDEQARCDQKCVNIPGSFGCACFEGFSVHQNGTCQDIDECESQAAYENEAVYEYEEGTNQTCEQKCVNTPGSFRCECHDGFRKGQNGSCHDIDECDVGEPQAVYEYEATHEYEERTNQTCEQKCVNTPGSFGCECHDGFRKGQGGSCHDINECDADEYEEGTTQSCEQKCVNTPGSFHCECHHGFHKNQDGSCHDIDECDVGESQATYEYEEGTNQTCEQKCVNTPGSFRCECHDGFRKDQNGSCHDIDECDADEYEGAHEHEEGTNQTCEHKCVNTPGSFRCECHDGFRKDQNGSCRAVCVESKPPGECPNGGTCVTPGVCRCPDGYQGDTCADIDECVKNVCPQNCQNTMGSYVCTCGENYVTNLAGECIEILLCGAGDDPVMTGCAPLCKGSDPCSCADGLKLHTNGKHCIDACAVKPCQHGGKCISNNGEDYRCHCAGTGYKGDNCETGFVTVPEQVRVRVGELYPGVNIDAKTQGELSLSLYNYADRVYVSPNPIIVRGPSIFDILVTKRGQYDLVFNVSSSITEKFEDVTMLSVRADDVFSRLQLRNSRLPVGCFWYLLEFEQNKLWFSSTSPWYRHNTSSVVYSTGVVMLVHNGLSLPIATRGLEIDTDFKVSLSLAQKEMQNVTKLPNHKDVSCEVVALSERDFQEFRQMGSAYWTLATALKDTLPHYMALSPAATNPHDYNFVIPQILSGEAVETTDICMGAPILNDTLYLVFRFEDPFIVTILGEMVQMNGKDLCILVDISAFGENETTFMFSDDAGIKFRNFSILKSLEDKTGLQLELTGFSAPLQESVQRRPKPTDLWFWNGARTFTYQFEENPASWLRMLVKRNVETSEGIFDFKMSASVQSFMTSPLPDDFLTHMFVGHKEIRLHLDMLSAELGVKIYGKRKTFQINQESQSRNALLVMGTGDDISECGANANPPGLLMNVSLDTNLFQGMAVIEQLAIGGNGRELFFFKTFDNGTEKSSHGSRWNKEILDLLTKLQQKAEQIKTAVSSTTKPQAFSAFYLIATNLTTMISNTLAKDYDGALFAEFTSNAMKVVSKIKDILVDVTDLFSNLLDQSFDELLDDLSPLVGGLSDISSELLRKLLEETVIVSPSLGTWGLNGTFNVTILGKVIAFKGALFVSAGSTTLCQERFSNFDEYLEGDEAIRLLGVVSQHTSPANSPAWGPAFWKYLSPELHAGIEMAFSVSRLRFISRLNVKWNLPGLNSAGHLYVSTEGVSASTGGFPWNKFPATVTVGAMYSPEPENWQVWIHGEFLTVGQNTFSENLWEAVRKATQTMGESALSRLQAGKDAVSSAQQSLEDARKDMDKTSESVTLTDATLNAEIANMDAAKKALERASQLLSDSGSGEDNTIEQLCKIHSCESVCVRRLTWGKHCLFLWSRTFPCFQPQNCAVRILHPGCVASNAVCRLKRNLIFSKLRQNDKSALDHVLTLDRANTQVIVSKIRVNLSRGGLEEANTALDEVKSRLKLAEAAYSLAGQSLADLEVTMPSGVVLLDALKENNLETYMDIRNCGFNNSLLTADKSEQEFYCQLKFLNTSWVKDSFVVDFKNTIGGVWEVAFNYVKTAMTKLQHDRRRRGVLAEDSFSTHRIVRRQAQNSHIISNISSAIHFWSKQCRNYQPNIDFIKKSLEFLNNITVRFTEEIEDAEQNITAYFKQFDIKSQLNETKSAGVHVVPLEYGVTQEQVDTAIENLDVEDDAVVREIALSVTKLRKLQDDVIQAYRNNKINVLWKDEMQSYTAEAMESKYDCLGFEDCLLFALMQIKSMMDSVNMNLVKDAAQKLPKFEEDTKILLGNDQHNNVIVDIVDTSLRLLEDLDTVDTTDIFCGTLPHVMDTLNNTTIVTGGNGSVACFIDAIPTPAYTWYKDGLVLPGHNQSTILFVNASLSDEGIYTCKGENHIGQTTSSGTLVIIAYPPTFVIDLPDEVRISRGDQLILFCNVSADPEAQILWYSSNEKSPISSEKILVLSNYAHNSSFLYKCVANNTYGQAESRETVVHVQSIKVACPSMKLQVKYKSGSAKPNEGPLLVTSLPSATSLQDYFQVAFEETIPRSHAEVVRFDDKSDLLEVVLSHECNNSAACSSAEYCSSLYKNASQSLVNGLDSLLQAVGNETALFVREGRVFHLSANSAKVTETGQTCPDGYTQASQDSCAPKSQFMLHPPSDIKLEKENDKFVLRWTPPDYAENFVKGYQITLRNRVDGKTITVKVSGAVSFAVLDGNYEAAEYDVTLAAFTTSHMSQPLGTVVDMGQIGNKLTSDTSKSNSGVAVGVSVAFCILLIAVIVGIIIRKYFYPKTKTAVESMVSTSSLRELGPKRAWVPIVAGDKVKVPKTWI